MADGNDWPLAFAILAVIFLGMGGIFSLSIALDILIRRGWRSMMAIEYVSRLIVGSVPREIADVIA